jgi:hypothetical protein
MVPSYDFYPLPVDSPILPRPFDSTSLSNLIQIRNKTLWYVVVADDKSRYIHLHIKKRRGNIRLLHAPNPVVKFAQKRLNKNFLDLLQEHLPIYVTAYRVGKDIASAVTRHIAKCPICDAAIETPPKHNCPRKGAYIQMDLKDFFHRTRRWWVGEMLEKNLGYPNEIAGPIKGMVTVRDIPCPTKRYPDGIRFGVPQGAPTSGAICNLVAYYRLDKPICEYLETLNVKYNLHGERVWVYSRYADDLAFTCGRDFPFNEKVEIVQELIRIIEETGYAVNRRKVHIRSSNRTKDLLGLNFSDRITIARVEYLRLRAIVHNCLIYGLETQYRRAKFGSPEQLLFWLKGKVTYVQQVDPRKGSNLHTELCGAIANYSALHCSEDGT